MPDQITVTFEPLPPPSGARLRSAVLAELAAELRARPMSWGCIGTYATHNTAASKAHNIRRGNLAAFRPAGAYAAESRKVNGEYRVYACYVGVPPLLDAPMRAFLTFALDLAADEMANRGDGFTADDGAALATLRKLAGGEQQ